MLTVSALAYYYIATPKTVLLAAGKTSLEQTLPDGTIVTLNAGSSIEYPEKFLSSTRSVNLKGEAYFQVTHDASHPFIVSANNASIEVLGTSFNVNTGALTGKMTVLLTEGKVAVYLKSNTKEKIHLAPGEKAEVENKTIKKSVISDANYMSWKTGRIVFDNTSLKQIAETLTQVYQTQVTVAPGLEKCTVTANFNNQSLEAVLNVLKATLDLQVIEKNNSLEITGKACN
jgi:ferric-dicitrate binding protein FerR (iron transport regulator)